MKTILLAVVVIFGISGCATASIPAKQAQIVPGERVFRSDKLAIDGNARVTFVRDVGVTAAGVYQHLFIDGKKAASINPGEKVMFILAPGEHIFGVIPTDLFGGNALNTIDQDLKGGRSYFYRIQTDGNSFRSVVQRFIPETE